MLFPVSASFAKKKLVSSICVLYSFVALDETDDLQKSWERKQVKHNLCVLLVLSF